MNFKFDPVFFWDPNAAQGKKDCVTCRGGEGAWIMLGSRLLIPFLVGLDSPNPLSSFCSFSLSSHSYLFERHSSTMGLLHGWVGCLGGGFSLFSFLFFFSVGL